jgi:hypothetical protein
VAVLEPAQRVGAGTVAGDLHVLRRAEQALRDRRAEQHQRGDAEQHQAQLHQIETQVGPPVQLRRVEPAARTERDQP